MRAAAPSGMIRSQACRRPAMRNFLLEIITQALRTLLRTASWRVLALALIIAPLGNAEDRFQTAVNDIMRGTNGAAIVSNPKTGAVLAVWNREVAFRGAFAPGSTAKLVTSAIALESDAISPAEKLHCRRVPGLLGEPYRCSHPDALEALNVQTALANSCNYFFAALSTRLDAATLARGYAMFGFGSAKGGDPAPRISSEPAAKARAALGESPILVTPEELLLAYSAVATRGTGYRLRRGERSSLEVLRTVRLKDATWSVLERGLEECVRSGTCQAAAVPSQRVAGKTGTAGLLDGSGITQAWFVGYAPVDSPEVAIVVSLGRGTGARDAAPLAGRILRDYFATRGAR